MLTRAEGAAGAGAAPEQSLLSDPALLASAPLLTPDLPSVGGRIKARPEDFLVEELPLYEPSGSGEHIYLMVEKRGVSTTQLVRWLARHFGVQPRAVGYAGMKDRHAVTRQLISIHTPGRTLEDFPALPDERLTVLWGQMHANKLRLGHLRGNRFSIKIREAAVGHVLTARRVLGLLEARGVPNFFGEQRFGVRQNNHVIGRFMTLGRFEDALGALLGPDQNFPQYSPEARALFAEGRFSEALDRLPFGCRPERAALVALARGRPAAHCLQAVDVMERRFWFSAFQSGVFNRVLRRRLSEGTWDRLVEGDLAYKHDNGAVFRVDRSVLEDPSTPARLSNMEISPSGPLWGTEVPRAEGAADRLETEALEASGVPMSALVRCASELGPMMSGTRRPLRVPLRDPRVEAGADEHGTYICCSFELPPGAFATVVMREIMKPTAFAPVAPLEDESPDAT